MTLFEEIKQLDRQHVNEDNDIQNTYSLQKASLENKKRKEVTLILVFFLIISITLGIIVGRFVFVRKIYGAHTVCYTTNTGKCYHSANCGSLWNSSHKTTVYKAMRRGLTSCNRCNVGVLDESNKYEYGWGILVCLIVIVPFPVIMSIKKNNKFEAKINQEKNNEIDRKNKIYKSAIDKIVKENGVLKIINAPSEVMYQGEKIVCNDEKYYRYVSTHGKCFHSVPYCGSNFYQKVWAYDIKGLSPCRKCAQTFTVPDWYLNYLELNDILKKYQLLRTGAGRNDYR